MTARPDGHQYSPGVPGRDEIPGKLTKRTEMNRLSGEAWSDHKTGLRLEEEVKLELDTIIERLIISRLSNWKLLDQQKKRDYPITDYLKS